MESDSAAIFGVVFIALLLAFGIYLGRTSNRGPENSQNGGGFGTAIFLAILGVVQWILAFGAVSTSLNGGTDIQLIVGGVWATSGSVCITGAVLAVQMVRLRRALEDQAREVGE